MKILLSTYQNPAFPAVNDHVETTLRQSGHQVVTYKHYGYRLPGRFRSHMPVLQRWEVRRLNERLIRLADSVRPDLLLVLGGITIEPRTVERIRQLSVTTANWFADYPAHFDYTMAAAPAYDFFFVSDSLSRARHAAAGHRNVHWLPFGCLADWAEGGEAPSGASSEVDCPDVVFVGSWYPERERLLRELTGVRLAVYGPGWERRTRDARLRAAIKGGALGMAQWRTLYRSTPVVLNIHYGFGGPSADYGAMANTRVFEALGAGGFLVTDEKKDLTALLTSGLDFAAYHTAAECGELIRYYLSRPEERRTIAACGQRRVLRDHTYRHRLRQLLELVGGSRA